MKSWKDILSAPHFTYEEMIEEGTELDKKYNLPLDEMESPGVCYMRIDDIFDNPYNKEIYSNITLVAYIQTDPVTVYRQELEQLSIQKAGIMLELKLLRGN